MKTFLFEICVFIFSIFIPLSRSADCIEDDPNLQHGLYNVFSTTDYVVLLAMLVISCGIGFIVKVYGDEQKTSEDFLLGSSSMGTLPMALSLAASFITAIELLGNPAEFYNHGSQFFLICIAFIIVVPITSKFYLPVFMKLRLTSSYEYLEMRFSLKVRLIASGLYILQMVMYTSVAVYAPALALSHVTGFNTYLAVTLVYVVCIFYASQGGMKAVIFTDTFQACVLISSLVLLVVMGQTLTPGGYSEIIQDSIDTERIEPLIWNPDLTIRHSVWSVVIGGTVYWLSMFCASQASIQKYLSVKSIGQVRIALSVSAFGLILIYLINFYQGAILYSKYKSCDPYKDQIIRGSDQLLPLYVMNVLGQWTGVPGIFVAGIFAASLGTVASAINSLAAVTMQDFLSNLLSEQIPENKGALVSKYLSMLYGLISFSLIFLVERLGSVLQMTLSFNGVVGGVILGLFTLGMFFPWASAKGAFVGALVTFSFLLWIAVGTQIEQSLGFDPSIQKPISVAGCGICLNSTIEEELMFEGNSDVFWLYRISYLWYSCIGLCMTVIIGLAVSYCTGVQDPCRVHPDLQSPPVHNFWMSLSKDNKSILGLPIEDKEKATVYLNIDSTSLKTIQTIPKS